MFVIYDPCDQYVTRKRCKPNWFEQILFTPSAKNGISNSIFVFEYKRVLKIDNEIKESRKKINVVYYYPNYESQFIYQGFGNLIEPVNTVQMMCKEYSFESMREAMEKVKVIIKEEEEENFAHVLHRCETSVFHEPYVIDNEKTWNRFFKITEEVKE